MDELRKSIFKIRCSAVSSFHNNHIINNFKHKVKESQTNYKKKARFRVGLVKHIKGIQKLPKIMARPRGIEPRSQASEACVISIGPRAQI